MAQVATADIDYAWIRAAFILKGTSFSRWCQENEVSRVWAIAVLSGRSKGPAANSLKMRIVAAASSAND